MPVTEYGADMIEPIIESFELNMTSEKMVFHFSERVNGATFNASQI
jgi:hypothetical protein